ncbi:nitric oxide reductase activation protein [Stenotrophobium rhamnosiphilum]|uniref:Nitric oxide reductase activation protein n=2 Tax=Stenotrophobium rhamnosiphilum TaxID=2029166 RepID=A0A2T5MDY9_9GAMM|nr:nitric oxide reductase activation protein [Stenotrophobium rhamnosiphilum]
MLASALSRRDIRVDHTVLGIPAWTNGTVIYVDGSADFRYQLKELCVQSALLVAGSLSRELVQRLARRPELAKRYLAVEGHRALSTLKDVLPPVMQSLIDNATASRSNSAADSLNIALSRESIATPPQCFGAIRARELLAAHQHAGGSGSSGQHVPRQQQKKELTELAEDANHDDEDIEDFATSPVGGGGGLGKLLQKMFQMVRKVKGDGALGADSATHWSRSGARAKVRAVHSTASAETVDDAFGKGKGILYPEWDVHQRRYRYDWCTVKEIDPPAESHTSVMWMHQYDLRKPLARLGMGLDRYHRQTQGDDIDIDAAIEAQVEMMAGSAPDESVYIESKRRRRDLSVLVLLDISGSVSQEGSSGTSVHDQQRNVAAALIAALHKIGDRVALYAFHSQGRSDVHLVPVKRFAEGLDNTVMSRLYSLKPGAYSRLGAAIRHGASVLIDRSGTSRRLLVVLSDGLAYDHGYEPAYGAADARQALAEARRDGVGCLCVCVGANTDAEVLRRVFGSAAHATIPNHDQLIQTIGPLFRSALRSTDVRRKFSKPRRNKEEVAS